MKQLIQNVLMDKSNSNLKSMDYLKKSKMRRKTDLD